MEDVQNVQIVCVWCQKEGVKRYSLCMGSELKSFCSEKCFAACRRAYFKRNKVSGEVGEMLEILISTVYGDEWSVDVDVLSSVDCIHTYRYCIWTVCASCVS